MPLSKFGRLSVLASCPAVVYALMAGERRFQLQETDLRLSAWRGHSLLVYADTARRSWQNLQFRVGLNPRRQYGDNRRRLVILGTGWGAMNIIRRVDISKWDVVVVSPRNFFAFTPLLPSASAGTVSERACIEPVRNKLVRGGCKVMEFYEAWATHLDAQRHVVSCRGQRPGSKSFEVPYDTLVIAVGSQPTTFGIPGVAENALFLKEVEHARAVRKRLLDAFEKAALPHTPLDEVRRILSFVVIGAGPTGVETAAEIADFIREEASIHWPLLAEHASVHVVEMTDRLLPAFQRECSEFARATFHSMGIHTHLRHAVTQVTADKVQLKSLSADDDEGNADVLLPAGVVVWASGLTNVPFTELLKSQVPEQQRFRTRSLTVDERLSVRGLQNVYAIGDCSIMQPSSSRAAAAKLFEEACKSSQGPSVRWLKRNARRLSLTFPQLHALSVTGADQSKPLSLQEFEEILDACDKAWRPPAPTAQMANQEGRYLSTMLNWDAKDAFIPAWRGAMAYVGCGQAIMERPNGKPRLGGVFNNALWRAFYMTEQMSFLNKCLCLFDWTKHALRGRDVARDFSTSLPPRVD